MVMHDNPLDTKENALWTEKKIRKWTTTYSIIDGKFFIEKGDRMWI